MKKILIIVILLFSRIYGFASDTVHVSVRFRCNEKMLTGRLILPVSEKKVPVVVYIEGSGPNSPLDPARKSWYDENFTKLLLSRGIGILYYNKQGIGGSEGKWFRLTFEERASETRAAVGFLKNDPRVDAGKIGILGHSQGGWIAQLAAARYPEDIRFAISVCGPSTNVFDQVVNDYQSELVMKGVDSLKANKKAVSKTRRLWFISAAMPVSRNLKQIKRIRNYDPAPALQDIKIPLLMIFGQYDLLVYPEWSLQRLDSIFRDGLPADITILVVPAASHGMVVKPSKFATVTDDQVRYSDMFHEYYLSWINSVISLR